MIWNDGNNFYFLFQNNTRHHIYPKNPKLTINFAPELQTALSPLAAHLCGTGGKSGQYRAPRHLTGGASLWRSTASVTENNRPTSVG